MITLPKEITKTREERTFPVDLGVLKKLDALRRTSRSDFVFPQRSNPNLPMIANDRAWQKLKKDLGIRGKQHWLRHTAATRFVRAGVSVPMIQASLGMTNKILKRVYLHASDEDFNKMRGVVARSLKGKK